MYKLLKNIISFFWYRKSLISFFMFCFSVFFIFMFPWSEIVEKIVRKSQKKMDVQIDFSDLDLNLFPPGITFKDISLDQKILPTDFSFDKLAISLAIEKWLALKPAFRVEIVKDQSFISATISKKKKSLEGQSIDYWSISSHSPKLDLSLLKYFVSDLKLEGQVSFEFQFQGSLDDFGASTGSLILQGSQIKNSRSQMNTSIGTIELPLIQWSSLNAKARLKESNVSIENITLGGATDDLYIQLRGDSSLRYAYRKIKLNSYDLQTQIEISKNFSLSLLDLFLSKTKTEGLNTNTYKARITGQGPGVPKVEKLDKF